jgi:hypothetical protein
VPKKQQTDNNDPSSCGKNFTFNKKNVEREREREKSHTNNNTNEKVVCVKHVTTKKKHKKKLYNA